MKIGLPEDNPNDAYEHYKCELCENGRIRLNEYKTVWERDSCDFREPNKQINYINKNYMVKDRSIGRHSGGISYEFK